MKLTVLGGGQEVGRSAVLLEDKKSIVMDFGTKIEPEPPSFPLSCKPDYAILSHAHLDHSGGLPILYKHKNLPTFMTDVTFELSSLLIKDSMKVAKKEGFNLPFSNKDVKKFIKHTKFLNYLENFSIGSSKLKLYDAGHIPGSCGIFIHEEKDIFYTGDIQTEESHLLHGCKLPKKADILITESTYSERLHPERKKEEKKLKNLIDDALANDGSVLLPVFAVGRSQEILLILEDYADMIAIDGMVRAASDIVSDYGAYVKNANKLREILSKVKFIQSQKERDEALHKHEIIISSAGMLSGGPSVHYLREMRNDINSKIIFTGFLIDGTPGRTLLQTGRFINHEEEFDVSCSIHQLDLSAHTDQKGLYKIIQLLMPEKVICVHGDKCNKFAKNIENDFNIEAYAPKNGEEIKIF